jgi:hypothetical protein
MYSQNNLESLNHKESKSRDYVDCPIIDFRSSNIISFMCWVDALAGEGSQANAHVMRWHRRGWRSIRSYGVPQGRPLPASLVIG